MINIDTASTISLFLSALASIVVVSTGLYKAFTKYLERTKNPLRFKSLSITHITELQEKNVISNKMSASLVNNADKRIFRENYKINLTRVYRDLIFNIEEQTNGILDADIFKMAEKYIQYTNGIIRVSNYSYYKFLKIFYHFMSLIVLIIIVTNGALFFLTLYLLSSHAINIMAIISILVILVTTLIYIYCFLILLRANRSLHARDLIIKCLLYDYENTGLFDGFSAKHIGKYIDIISTSSNRYYKRVIEEDIKYKLNSENWIILIIILYSMFFSFTIGAVTIILLD